MINHSPHIPEILFYEMNPEKKFNDFVHGDKL